MSTPGSWTDFDIIRATVRSLTVDKLKAVIQGLHEECYTNISKTGKKQELIDRITSNLEAFRTNNMEDRWSKAKTVINQIRDGGSFARSYPYSIPVSTYAPATTAAKYTPASPAKLNYNPSRPSLPSAVVGMGSRGLKPAFKESPFFRVDQTVSAVAECPESSSSTDRRQSSVSFSLTSEQLEKLKNPRYQLRLFCTSSTFFSLSPAFKSTSGPCLIEFPPTCEVRVNSVLLTASLKGLKKKPGTAPPPDLGKYIRLNSSTNRIEMVYVNSQQQPVQAKKYYLIVMLVETTEIEKLVSRLETECRVSAEDILKDIKASVDEDDDIVAGPQKMSVKCPLSFMRVKLPCRSSKCVHRQCFDATSWYEINEQTTTWLCPVCERQLEDKDLIIDGYFEQILKSTERAAEEVEDVIIEADGEWHTQDNVYGSAAWKAQHPPTAPAPISRGASPTKANGKGKEKAEDVEIFVLDSDDEDANQVKRELSAGIRSTSTATTSTRRLQESVIDLTLDSDDESPQPPPQPTAAKRSAEAAGLAPADGGSKRGRTDNGQYATLPQRPRAMSPSRQLPLPTTTSSGSAYHLPPPLDYSRPGRTW